MPRLLIVHGTGAAPRTEESLRLEWLNSILDGLAFAGDFGTGAGDRFVDTTPFVDTVRLVDVDRHAPPCEAAPDRDGATIAAWARTTRITLRERTDLASLGRSRYFCGIPEDELLRTARLHHAFDRGLADEAVARVVDAITEESPDVVIGHAFGGVAAYEAVRAVPTVSTLITVGAPPAGRTPPPDTHWVSLVARWDPLAAPAAGDVPIGAVPVECSPRLRAPRSYLATPEFGKILSGATARD
ncbi:hypothetical protein AB0I82_33765 [Streptomyces sp. NPDC050315]|uniref:hypothetical protein n=1 Tax=Streptomyces sp. NPDC050315 TaxID=3155039 RepID=UPI0034361321